MTLEAGSTLGRYRIIGPLGQGGMAAVYRAYQASLDREIALKVLRPAFATDAEFVKRFEQEARAIARLRHPNIVQVFDFEEESGSYLLAMELLDGGTLKEHVDARRRDGGSLAPGDAARIIGDVAAALSFAHERGVVHRDVKPSNVMLSDGRAVVTDFGIARMLQQTSHTQTGVGIGTPEYMAPEQGQGKHVDHRADIYSLGVMAYELLTGALPYTADTPLAVVIAHIRAPLPLPSAVNPAIGPRTEQALLKALAKDPQDRFVSARDFAQALREAIAADARVEAAPPAPARLPGPALAAIAIAAALVLGGVAFAATRPSTEPATPISAAAGSVPRPTATPRYLLRSMGAAVWAARLDGTNELTLNASVRGDAEIRAAPGVTTLAILDTNPAAGASVTAGPPVMLPTSYATELDLAFAPGSKVGATWVLRSSAEEGWILSLVIEPDTEQMRLQRSGNSPFQYDYIPIPGLAAGRAITLTVNSSPPRYGIFLDGTSVFTADNETAGGANTMLLSASQRLGGTGELRVSGLRIFEGNLPSTFVPTPAPSRTPAPTIPPRPAATPHVPPHAVPPKGALVYDAQLVAAELVRSGCPGKAQDTTLVFGPRAATFSLLQPNDALCWRLNANGAVVPQRVIIELDLTFADGSDCSLQILTRQAAGGTQARSSFVLRSAPAGIQPVGFTQDAQSAQPELAPGKTATVAIAIASPQESLYVNERLVGTFTEGAADAATLLELRFSGTKGSVTLSGLRLYALP